MSPDVIPEWAEARRYILPVATQKEWTDDQIKAAWSIIDLAAEAADTQTKFWQELRRSWVANVPKNPPATWPDLLPVWAAALNQELGEEERDWSQSFLGVVAGTVAKSAEDVKQAGKALPKAAAAAAALGAIFLGGMVIFGGKKEKIRL